MKTVHEVSELTGVSIRTLRYYDKMGLLHPSSRTDAGYRLYDYGDLLRLQQILLFRELEFPLKDIRDMMDSPGFEQTRALEQQIRMLELKRDHIERLIRLAHELMEQGGTMDFGAFDTSTMDEYAAKAKAAWGKTREWEEFAEKSAHRTKNDEHALGEGLMALFDPFGRMAAGGTDPASDEAKAQAKRIQDYISEHYYRCSDEVFAQLGRAYGSGGEFTRNINAAAGDGAGEFAAQAVAAYVGDC